MARRNNGQPRLNSRKKRRNRARKEAAKLLPVPVGACILPVVYEPVLSLRERFAAAEAAGHDSWGAVQE